MLTANPVPFLYIAVVREIIADDKPGRMSEPLPRTGQNFARSVGIYTAVVCLRHRLGSAFKNFLIYILNTAKSRQKKK